MVSDERQPVAEGLRRVAVFGQLLLAVIPVASLLVAVGYLVSVADRGFDITDEGYYLLHAQHPRLSTVADLRSFGYYTNILYRLAGGEIAWFRLLGVGCLLVAAGLFAVSAVRVINRQLQGAETAPAFLAKVAFIVVGVLLYYVWTIVTPSYNLLN